MAATYEPVVVVASGGVPVKDLGAVGATPYTAVSDKAVPVTLVTSANIPAMPITLYNEDGSLYASNH